MEESLVIYMVNYSKGRLPFTDGFNSLSHFVFGVLAFYWYIIIPIFIIYQLKDIWTDKNVFIDILEFILGFITIYLLSIIIVLYQEPRKNGFPSPP